MTSGPALVENGRTNPAYLKLDLFCRGLRVAEDCRLDGRLATQRVRAGLGSGLEMRIRGSGGMWVNAPVREPFAQRSPYALHGPEPDGAHVLRYEGRPVARVDLARQPAFYDRRTRSGKLMGSVGALQGTYLGVYYGMLCANWKHPAQDACRFCAVGLHVGTGEERTDKSPADVVETALAAHAERGITFVHVNGGFDDGDRYLERFAPVVDALRRETGLLIGLQVPPLPDVQEYRELKRLGVNNLSLCFELWDRDCFAEVCPGKDRRAGLERYLTAIRACSSEIGFDTTNGEIIAGLEPTEDSVRAVDWLTEHRAVPTVCVFRPVVGTAYADRPPPETAAMVPLFAHLYRRCMERGLRIGIAPGVRVSIVLTPEECRGLLPPAERGRWPLRRLKHAAMRRALGGVVARRVRRAAHRPTPSRVD